MPADPVAESGQGAPVRRPEELPQPVGGLVQDLQERRVEVPEQRLPEGDGASGYGLDGPGPSRVRARSGMSGTLTGRQGDPPFTVLATSLRNVGGVGGPLQPAPPEEDPAVEQFGDHAALADELLGLVLAGTKRATAGLVADFAHEGEPLPRIGGHWVACDGAGHPGRCCARRSCGSARWTASTTPSPGTRARATAPAPAGWRPPRLLHPHAQARGEAWDDDLEVVFERFRVVWPPEVAD